MENLSGHTIKGYELRERLGAGGFGAVYKVYQSTVGREVAVKIILPHFSSHPDFIRRFETEAQLVARLEHLHIIPLYDYWRDSNGAYLVMRWLKGGSLRDALQNGAFTPDSAAALLDQITSGLSAAHRNSVIHRDLKPGNILLDEDGNAYLADFGIAKDLGAQGGITEPDAIMGSPDYLAPEQAQSEQVTARTDIYSLGVVLYEILAGQHPFPNTNIVDRLYKHLNEPLPEITTLADDIRDAVNEVIQKATAKNPLHRYADALEFASAFRAAIKSSSTLVETLTQREQEILRLIIEGRSNKEIAQQLYVTLMTVKWYITQIYRKLGVRSRVQAIVRARELNLISPSGTLAGEAPPLTSVTMIPTDQFQPENPYKGLHAFQSADHQDFFGREKLVEKLLKRLSDSGLGLKSSSGSDDSHSSRFLAVVGPSGSGKSSLVKAGVIPSIWRGDLSGSEKWYVVEMLPGARPLDEVEIALTRVAANQAVNLNEQLRRDKNGLLRAASLILPNDNSELLIVIDQFEEVFTLVEDETERINFLKLLHSAVSQPRSRVRIIVTLRADFYDRPLHYPEFGELVRSNMETILPLSADGLERAIAKPAERMGVGFEPGLVAAIMSDVNYQPGALPLLQYALTELFEQRQGRMLTLEAYQAIGRTTGALAKRAEEIFLGLDLIGQETARQMFLRLVTLGEGVEDTRRRTPRSELLALVTDSDAADEIIDIYAESRLFSLDNDPGTRTPTVEVAHEAILREWERLREWLNDSREDIRLERQLLSMATEWKSADEEASFLLRGSRLETFEKWAAETKLALTPDERVYLQTSLANREREQAAEQERQARETRLERRSTLFLRGLVGVLLLATLGAFGLTSAAVNNASEAQRSANQFHSLALAADSQLALNEGNNGDLARLLGLEAVKIDNPPARAQLALSEVAYAPGTRWLYNDLNGTVNSLAITPDGRYAALGLGRYYYDSPAQADNSIQLIDLETHQLIRVFQGHHDSVYSLAFSPDGRYLVSDSFDAVTGSPDTSIILWDVETGTAIRRYHDEVGAIYTLAFTPDGRHFISYAWNEDFTQIVPHSIILWDVESDKPVRYLAEDVGTMNHVNFSPDGQYISVIPDEKLGDPPQTRILVYDSLSGEQVSSVLVDSSNGFNAINSDKHILFNLSGELAVSTWDIQTSEPIKIYDSAVTFDAFGNWTEAALSPDAGILAIAHNGGEIQLRDLTTWQEVGRFRGNQGNMGRITFSVDGQHLLSTAEDGVRLWDLQPGALLRSYDAPPGETLGGAAVRDVAFLPDGHSFLSLSRHGILLRRDLESGDILQQITYTHNPTSSEVTWGLDVTPDGKMALVGTDNDGAAVLYDLATEEVKLTLQLCEKPMPPGSSSCYVHAVDISPDGRTALTGDDATGGMILWDLNTGADLHHFETSVNPDVDGLSSLAYSPDGRRALVGLNDGVMILYDLTTYAEIRRFGEGGNGHTSWLIDVDFSPDGRLALSSSADSTLILWDVESGALLHRLVGHSGEIRAAAFSPDGTLIASASRDGTIMIWDVATGEPIRHLRWNDAVFSIAFSSDGKKLLTGGSLGEQALWRVDSTLDDLTAWTTANRYVPQPTCVQRELYQLEPLCVGNEQVNTEGG